MPYIKFDPECGSPPITWDFDWEVARICHSQGVDVVKDLCNVIHAEIKNRMKSSRLGESHG